MINADTIEGGAGNDTINGLDSDDLFTGGSGNDTFVFNSNFGEDVITDFQAGALSDDLIQFASLIFRTLVRFFNDVLAVAVQDGTDTVITSSTTNKITFNNVTLTDLNQDDFSFV